MVRFRRREDEGGRGPDLSLASFWFSFLPPNPHSHSCHAQVEAEEEEEEEGEALTCSMFFGTGPFLMREASRRQPEVGHLMLVKSANVRVTSAACIRVFTPPPSKQPVNLLAAAPASEKADSRRT